MTRSAERHSVERVALQAVPGGRLARANASRAHGAAPLQVAGALGACRGAGRPRDGGREPGAGPRAGRSRTRSCGPSTREAFDLYARYWFDTFHVVRIPVDELLDRVRMRRASSTSQEALEAGTGVIWRCRTWGTGTWPPGGSTRRGIDPVAVAEELEPPELFDLFLRHREAAGDADHRPVGRGGSGSKLREAIASNHLIALVADRDLTGRGVEVEMFGTADAAAGGPGAPLARDGGAARGRPRLHDRRRLESA